MTMVGHPDQRWGGRTYSQHGEDLLFLSIFEQLGIQNPSWLDIGAHHPENISNTKLLYDLGFRGVNVEANPNLYMEFLKQRPEDTNICIGVGLVNGSARFYMYDDTSGRNTFSEKEVKEYNHTVRKETVLPVTTLDKLVDDYCSGNYPHLLSIDVEGLDYDVLNHANFLQSSPVVVCVETRLKDSAKMQKMMNGKGYVFYVRMGENMIFVHELYFRRLLPLEN
jgi:FkbM family methyltransferase